MASEQAMALYRKLNASGTAITNSNWREWDRMASAAMKMQDFTPPGQSDSLHDLANEVGIEIQALKSRASRSGQPDRFVEFDDKDTQAIIASGQAILRNIRTTGYAPADAVVAKIRSATTDAIAALKAGKMVPYSVNGKPMGTRRKNLNSGEVAALRARIVAAINVNQLKSFADQTVMIAEKDWIARGRPEHESRSRLYEIYDVAWKNWYYANELMSKGPNNTILVDRPVSRGFSRPGAKATFKVEDCFYFGKSRKERFAITRQPGSCLYANNTGTDVSGYHSAIAKAIEKGGKFDSDFSDVFKLTRSPAGSVCLWSLTWA
jgi:hypothetical protein